MGGSGHPAHVLRFPRSDEEGSFVLVHAVQTRSKALDMKLTGTDGLAPYVVNLRHTQAASYMAKNCPASEEEWTTILSSFLRQEHVEGVEAIATVDSESAIHVTLRKRVRGITQRLGAIELKHNADEEIELYDWCGMSVQAVAEANASLASVTGKMEELEESVRQLKSQLDEFINAKKQDETQLLLKFRDLLNEKKVKIREQQRIIAAAGARGDDAQGAEDAATSAAGATLHDHHKAGKSRPSKRKAGAAARAAEEDEDESSDGFEKMDVDSGDKKPTTAEGDASGGEEDRQTTDDEAETASEDDGEEEEEQASKPASKKPAAKPSTRAASASQSQTDSHTLSSSSSKREAEAPPARRDLPFLRKKAPQKEPIKKENEGSETESDDEL